MAGRPVATASECAIDARPKNSFDRCMTYGDSAVAPAAARRYCSLAKDSNSKEVDVARIVLINGDEMEVTTSVWAVTKMLDSAGPDALVSFDLEAPCWCGECEANFAVTRRGIAAVLPG